MTFVDQSDCLRALSDALTATQTPARISAITSIIEIIVARLRERALGAPASPPVRAGYDVDVEAERLIDWMSRGGFHLETRDADTLCGEGEEGNKGESFN